MLLDLSELARTYSMAVRGILHVGANTGQEADLYSKLFGIKNVVWVEGNPDLIPKLESNVHPYGHKVIQALVHDVDGVELDFHIASNEGQSSSILSFGTHAQSYPDTIFIDDKKLFSRTVDSLVNEFDIKDTNLMVLDLQGAEGLCLMGAKNFLKQVDYIITEVNSREVYVGNALIEDLDKILSDFIRVETFWVGNEGWGDAAYLSKRLL